ncbi:lysine-rich nucleolar protein 1 isoform X2 [Syngnathus acus]|uniref:lysine-rich nucleolar protein 1 isoform X2 n=1 Tax=Syngnathus acus TaxID=161584 RepID=UPI001885DA97|nr:lysine-rich nucleolar protein 1 isoform X2 [Syngnathus acus]
MNQMCKRDSEEVLFISEWISPRPKLTVVIDQVRRLALQRDIDQESLPKQISESNDRSALVKRCEEKMKMKKEDVIDENVEKYSKKKQTSPQKMNVSTVDETAQRVDMKKKQFQKYDSVVTVQGPLEVGGEEKPKKKVVNGCNIIDGNCNETNIKKTQTDIQKGTKKTSNDKKSKNKTLTNHENHQDDEKVAEQPKKRKNEIHDEKVAKKAKKEKNKVNDEIVAKKAKKEKNEILDKKVSKKAMKEKNEVHDEKVSKKASKEKNEVHDEKGSKKPKEEKNEVHDEKVSKKARKKKKEVQDENVAKKPKKEKNEVHDENVAKKPKKDKNEVHDEKMAKKPKKDKNEVHDTNHVTDDSAVIKVKVKKEKDKSECKEKKVKDMATQIEHEEVWMGGKEKKVLKKAKKEPNKMPLVSAGDIKHKAKTKKNVAEQTETSIKKKTAKLKLSESEVATETSEGLCELKPKKKKKKDASPDKEQPVDSSKAAARKQEKAAKSDVEEGETKQKEKKEKPKKRKPSGLGTDEETASVKKKKQKIEEPNCEETQHQEPNKKRKKKSPVKKEKVLEGVCPDSCMKKKEIQRKPKKVEEIKVESDHQWDDLRRVPQVDVVFLSEKTGNTDELTINQERRQALQMEVDKASHPQKADQASGFGQWSTAQFENCQQQQKFLRLMGGFKNFQPAAVASTPKPNMALDKVAQERLQQGLWSEFERAHSRRIDFNNQGAGLGFSKSPQKQFFIDINACHSVHFDD